MHIEPVEYNDLNWSKDEKCMVIHRMAVNSKFRKCKFELVGQMSFLGKEKPFNCYEKML